DDPEDVKARLKFWAQAVACTVAIYNIGELAMEYIPDSSEYLTLPGAVLPFIYMTGNGLLEIFLSFYQEEYIYAMRLFSEGILGSPFI
ncbi:hypothetical protein Tco_0996055, partial [Tanacetum coccineum]